MKRGILVILVLVLSVSWTAASGAREAPAPLGSEKNPIIWAFVPSGEMERVSGGARQVADLLFNKTGLHFKTMVATEYAGVIEAMAANPPSTHMSSLATAAIVMAIDRGVAEVAMVALRNNSLSYNGQLIVRKDSGISKVEDLRGKTFARPDPLSASGWIAPMLILKAAGIDPAKDLARIVDAGSHDAVVTAVYNGDVAAGATYADARTRVEKQFPDVMDRVVVIGLSPPIPNDGIQFHPSVPKETRDKICDAILEIIKTDEGKKAINTAYQWTALQKKDNQFYDPYRQFIQAAGMKAEDLMPKKK